MDWLEIYRELETQVDFLADRAAFVRSHGSIPIQTLFDAEAQERATIDAACIQYATTGWLPKLSQVQTLLFYIRLGHAAQFAELLARHEKTLFHLPHPEADSRKPTALKFLLVDYWRFAGNSRWRTT